MKTRTKSIIYLVFIATFIVGAITLKLLEHQEYNYKIHTAGRYYYTVEKPELDKTTSCINFNLDDKKLTTVCGTYSVTEIRKPQEEN